MSPRQHRRQTFYDRTVYNNRWYRWLALASAILALGVLIVFLMM